MTSNLPSQPVHGSLAQSLSTLIAEIFTESSNSDSSLFLPAVVLEQWPGADPWSVSSINFGDLNALNPALPSQLCNAITGNDIASPASAILNLTSLTISGLANAVLTQPSVQGSSVTATVNFGAAQAPASLSLPAAISVAANFNISLACCTSSDGVSCSSTAEPASINGTVNFSLTQNSVLLEFSVADDFSVTVDSMSFTGTASGPQFQVTPPSVSGGALQSLLENAFATAAGIAAISTAINTALSTTGAQSGFGAALTPILQSVANPKLLSFVASELYTVSNNPKNSLYLPTQIKAATNPTLDPYNVSGAWNFGDVSALIPSAGMQICGPLGATEGVNEIATPATPVNLILSNVVLAGLSNAQAYPFLTLNDNTIEALVVFGQIPNYPSTFSISGNFSLSLSCCITEDFATCSGPPQPQTGNGTFSATLVASGLAGNIGIAANCNQLIATVNGLQFRADPNLLNTKNVVFDINITSVPANQQAAWNTQTAKLFNSSEATAAIMAQIQLQVNQPSVLAQLGQMITNAIGNIGTQDLRSEVVQQILQGSAA